MPVRYIKCQNCPTWFKTPFVQRKYCQTCQIIRDYEVFPHKYTPKPTVCVQCAGEFFPARPNWVVCGQCRNRVEEPSRYDPCHRCAKHYRPAPGLEATCSACVQESQVQRLAYVDFLYEARERLIADDPAPPQAYLDWANAQEAKKKVANSGKNWNDNLPKMR